jgi:hypothetical protein
MTETPHRNELRNNINILKEKFPSLNISKITDDMTDDQVEIMYLKKLIEVEDRSKFKETLEKLAIILAPMIPSNTTPTESNITITHHHIIKFG